MNVRPMRFEPRSALPVSAACVLANGVRETLGALFGKPATLRLMRPVIPDTAAWNVIAEDALLLRARGTAADAAFVLRPRDASALAAAAFGEEVDRPRELSPVEREVVMRAMAALAGCLSAVCGREVSALEHVPDVSGYTTYFELLVERPAAFRLGIALAREPAAKGGPTLRLDDLLDVEIELSVRFAAGVLAGGEFLGLGPGADVPMKTRIGEAAALVAGGTVLARGECGALGERSAMVVKAAP